MSIYRSGQRGTWILERTFRRVGRIKRATGLYQKADAQELDRLLERLSHLHRDELIRAFRDGTLPGDELYAAYRLRGIDGLPSVEALRPLRPVMEAWLQEASLAPRTRSDYEGVLDRLLALGGSEATLGHLPEILRRLRDQVRGVSFSYSGEADVMGAVITALKEQATNAPLVVNTPHATAEPVSEDGDPEVCLTTGCVNALEALERQAWKYVDGLREQGDLFAARSEPALAVG